ncbi:MAG: restriction endonuclease subunit R [Epulopiscium sp. Nele67-Bin002]|nr:MAG: restriction endonuclease subunit R [Epulopiscium sp. Nele67-Bin001]OON92625.1 MAG: restriction endonuclease subunit R [Epulopiscium sp. Nele67-Bin002]
MKLQFKNQAFQEDAANAVVNVFKGQPYITPTYMIDKGMEKDNQQMKIGEEFTGWCNQPIVPELNDKIILDNITSIQRKQFIKPSDKLEGRFNLTIEMETGVGKTYTYIKTMYELNKHYGWSKFIVVVPSVAIREGVYKSFEITQEHFAEEYGKKIRFFIYNSTNLTEIDNFASSNAINVMIINSQAFNAKDKDARRIYLAIDDFKSRRPIDIIAKTNPIIIIDEPQSVEGKKTKERLIEFNPLMTLRYSATHKKDSIYNMVYRLDAMDAYNQKLVKKIVVKGISESGSTNTEGYVYLEEINLSKSDPMATIQFDVKGANGVRKVSRKVGVGYNLYDKSGELEEYKDNFIVKTIDGRDNSIEFVNGIKMHVGEVIGKVSEEQIRRIQIRETILSHIELERQLFYRGIKVLSLFFIDKVAKYKQYDDTGNAINGTYADMFEEEYFNITKEIQLTLDDEPEYFKYLDAISQNETHAGYFSVDNKGRVTNSTVKRGETSSSDISAYDLIMKNKELLLDINPRKSPVRFIFSHSALKEGWDNPNVFQICTLKHSGSDIGKRQEVGRGLRICVNQDGKRMDINELGSDVHNINILTVIASESYESFATALQNEISETVIDRPKKVDATLFINHTIKNSIETEKVITTDLANSICDDLLISGYIDKKGVLTDKYYEDKANDNIKLDEKIQDYAIDIIEIIDSVYNSEVLKPEDGMKYNVELRIDKRKLDMQEFQNLWELINKKSVYVVDFNPDELVSNAIHVLNNKLIVPKVFFTVETGEMNTINTREDLVNSTAFNRTNSRQYKGSEVTNQNIKYDLVGKLVDNTGLTRKDIIKILKGIKVDVFDQFKYNPEEFIIKCSGLINEQKTTSVIEHIAYNTTDETYSIDIFTDSVTRGNLNKNTIKANKHLYDHVRYDSDVEKQFASDLDVADEVAVYVKLPSSFYISTPVGKYNPDWAIAFYEREIKHIYFVAETKGTLSTLELREVEKTKEYCAKQHFKEISNDKVQYEIVPSYGRLLEIITK